MRFFARLTLAALAFLVCVAWLSNALLQGIYICQGPNCPQVINGVTLSGNTFVGGAASGTVVGTISVSMGPASPAFSGSLSLTGTNASSFQVAGSNLQTNGIVPVGTYQFNIVATQSGAVNSPFQGAVQVTGTTAVVGIAISCGSSCAFNSGTAGAVGTASATLNSGSFTGTWSLASSGADHAGTTCNNYGTNFTIVSGTGVLSNSSGAPPQAYPGVCVVATQAGLSNSPYTQAVTVTGNSSATFPLSVSSGILQTAGGAPYLLYGDAPQGANNIPLCSTGNTYALCSVAPGANDTLAGGQHTFLAYLKDRKAQGFNSLWINILCEWYTACATNGANQDGTFPFTSQLSGAVHSPDACPENGSVGATPNTVDCWDMASGINVNGTATGANAAYWTHVDGYFLLAADQGMQILANPIPTDNCDPQSSNGSYGYTFLNNNAIAASKITGYADFIANRYKNTPNLTWFLFNDYTCWNANLVPSNFISGSDTVFYNFASRLVADEQTSGGFKHLVTSELYGNTTSLWDSVSTSGNNWSTVITLNGVYYNLGPPYDGGLLSRVQSAAAPAILVEGSYLGEDLGGIDDGTNTGTNIPGCGTNQILNNPNAQSQLVGGNTGTCAFRERVQFWKLLLTGAAGYVNGNTYSWQLNYPGRTTNWFASGNPTGTCTGTLPQACLDVPANAQILAAKTFLLANSWYKLVPDYTRSVNGSGFGIGTAIASPFINASTGCYGNPCANYYRGSNNNDGNNIPKATLWDAFVTSGAANDGSFAMAYVQGINPGCGYPNTLTNCVPQGGQNITVNDAKINGGANLTAAWYDPTGAMTSAAVTVCSPSGTACSAGSRTYTTPAGLHADGTADWVLLITGTSGGTATAYLSATNLEVSTLNAGVNTTIPNGGSATLTWDSTNAATCTSSDFATGNSPGIGTVTVSPTTTTTYHLTCGSALTTAQVAVSGTRRDAAAPANIGVNGCAGAGTIASPWNAACIQNAINVAAAGDTVFLRAGNWRLNTNDAAPVSVNKSFNLVGAGSGNTFDAWGHINNVTSSGFSTCSGVNNTTVTCVYQGGTSYAFCGAPGPPFPTGGYIQIGLQASCTSQALGSIDPSCANITVAHIGFDGSPVTAGGDVLALLNFEGCAGPITVDDLRFVAYTGIGGNGTFEGQFYPNQSNNVTIKNSLFADPFVTSNSSYSGAQAMQMNGGNGIGQNYTVINNAIHQGAPNPIFISNYNYSGNQQYNFNDGHANVGYFPPGNAWAGAPYGGAAANFCPEAGTTASGQCNGDVTGTFTNNLFYAPLNPFGVGGGVNDPATSGGINKLNVTGNWIIASTGLISASCIWDLLSPACNQGVGANNDNVGMGVNASVNASCVLSQNDAFTTPVTNNSILATTAAQLDATGNPTAGLSCRLGSGATGPTIPINVYGFDAEKNYLSSPSNQYLTNANTISPTQIGNFCTPAVGGLGAGCTTTGFTTPPTASFSLGTLYADPVRGSVVTINSPIFTAQYGAVQWLASTTSTTPLSSDSRWSSNNGSFPNAAANSYVPPASLSGVSHGSTVYLWVMDSASHISAATPVAVP